MAPSVPLNPFPGLRHFETSEEYLFFGREGQSEEILRRLGQNRLVAVVGTSGSGKSSLVRAGLLPYLYGGFLANTGSHWRVALFRPGIDPIGNLARSLNSPEVLGAAAEGQSDARGDVLLEVTLRRSGLGLVDAVKLARLAPHENILVIVDQFEELFRFAGAGETGRSEDDAAAFVKLLLEAGRQTDLPVYVALTMRSDWIGDCARYRDLPEAVASGLYLIPRMTRDQRRAAIEEPVRVAQGEISSRLVNRMLNDVGDNPDQLPILQHAMMRTWEFWSTHRSGGAPMDLQDYSAIGAMATALSKHADEAYQELPSDRQRAIAKRIFQALTDKDTDNREVRRPTSVAKLVQATGAESDEVFAVIESFRRRGRSFLMPPEEVRLTNDTIIDISHESLIRGWQRLRDWVEEESESAKVYRRLADTAVLHAQSKAGLWRDPDLLGALTWREAQHPTSGWAQRYHPDFDLAVAFLERSRHQRDAETAEAERKRNEELHRARRQLAMVSTASAIAVACLIAVAAGVYFVYRSEQQRHIAETAYTLATQKQKEKTDIEMFKLKFDKEQALKNAGAAKAIGAHEEVMRVDAENQVRKQAKLMSSMTDAILSSVSTFDDLPADIKSQKAVQEFHAQLLQGQMDLAASTLQFDPDSRNGLVLAMIARVTFADLRNGQGFTAKAEADCAKNEAFAHEESVKTKSYFHRMLGAVVLASTGETWTRLGKYDRALQDARQAVVVADGVLPDADPKDDLSWRLLSTAYNVAGGTEEKALAQEEVAGHPETATSLRREALAAYRHAGEARKQSFSGSTAFSFSKIYVTDLNEVADLQHQLKEGDDEIKTRSEAIHFAESLASQPNADPAANDLVFWSYVRRGGAYQQASKFEQAEKDLDEAHKSAQRIDPASHDGQVDRMIVDDHAARLMRARADQEAGRDSAQMRIDLNRAAQFDQRSLVADRKIESDKDTPGRRRSIAVSELELGNDYERLAEVADSIPAEEKDREQARQYLRDTIKDREAAMLADPTDDASRDLARAYQNLRVLEVKAGDYGAAQKASDGMIHWWQPLAIRPSALASDKSALADSYGSRSWLDVLLSQFDQAVQDADAGFSYDGEELWILANKAHAFLFLGRREAALTMYRNNARRLAYPEDKEVTKTFGEAALEDFETLRKMPQFNARALDEAEKVVRDALAASENPAKNTP